MTKLVHINLFKKSNLKDQREDGKRSNRQIERMFENQNWSPPFKNIFLFSLNLSINLMVKWFNPISLQFVSLSYFSNTFFDDPTFFISPSQFISCTVIVTKAESLWEDWFVVFLRCQSGSPDRHGPLSRRVQSSNSGFRSRPRAGLAGIRTEK